MMSLMFLAKSTTTLLVSALHCFMDKYSLWHEKFFFRENYGFIAGRYTDAHGRIADTLADYSTMTIGVSDFLDQHHRCLGFSGSTLFVFLTRVYHEN
jgi:hypothetical protein